MSFGSINIFSSALSYASNVASPEVAVPSGEDFLVIGVGLQGAAGNQGDRQVVSSFGDSESTVQRILGERAASSPQHGVPFRHLGAIGNGQYRFFQGASDALFEVLRRAARDFSDDVPDRALSRALLNLQRLTGETNPNIGGFILGDGAKIKMTLTDLTAGSDAASRISFVALSLGRRSGNGIGDVVEELNAPYWFAEDVLALATTASTSLRVETLLDFPLRVLPNGGAMRHVATRASMYAQSGGTRISTEGHLVRINTEDHEDALDHFPAAVPIAAFAEDHVPIFDQARHRNKVVKYAVEKETTGAAAYLYVTEALSVQAR